MPAALGGLADGAGRTYRGAERKRGGEQQDGFDHGVATSRTKPGNDSDENQDRSSPASPE
jgi:hypothetical protein